MGCQQSHVQRFIDTLVSKNMVEIEGERKNVRPIGLADHIQEFFA